MIASAIAMVAAAIALVRLGWAGRPGVAALGWLLAGATLVALAQGAGAWGFAVGAIAGMTAALGTLAWSGWSAPGHAPRSGREKAASPSLREPARLARRGAVFLLVVPVGGAAALWLAFGAQAVAREMGMQTADAYACLLLLAPVFWCSIMTWQMTRNGPCRMVAAPLFAALLGTLLWAAW